MKKIKEKLHSRAGESIAETLVALLISAVALVMLASMISASTSIITKSRNTLKEYYAENNKLEEMDSNKKRGTLSLKLDGVDFAEVDCYENAKFSNHKVIAYAAPTPAAPAPGVTP